LVQYQKAFLYLNQLHQVPCSRCVFFTGEHRLKCTVDPLKAMSIEAINCRDFEQKCHTKTNLLIQRKFFTKLKK
jgi:hypothetical protein